MLYLAELIPDIKIGRRGEIRTHVPLRDMFPRHVGYQTTRRAEKWSGRQDLNLRKLAPEASASTRLGYVLMVESEALESSSRAFQARAKPSQLTLQQNFGGCNCICLIQFYIQLWPDTEFTLHKLLVVVMDVTSFSSHQCVT